MYNFLFLVIFLCHQKEFKAFLFLVSLFPFYYFPFTLRFLFLFVEAVFLVQGRQMFQRTAYGLRLSFLHYTRNGPTDRLWTAPLFPTLHMKWSNRPPMDCASLSYTTQEMVQQTAYGLRLSFLHYT